MHNQWISIWSLIATLPFTVSIDVIRSPVKVFILCGQSNMEGKGSIEHLDELTKSDPDTYGHLKTKSGKWRVREDVWIEFLGCKGGLTVGYAQPPNRFGPELQFGNLLGDALAEPVLLIKTAWGGRSLAVDFRSPSAGKVPYELDEELQARIDNGEYKVGTYFHETVSIVYKVLEDLDKHFPAFKGHGYEIAGFVWFQGWNDRINQQHNDHYADNLSHFIRDVRKAFGNPNLPFIIGESGQGGVDEKHPRALSLMQHQVAVAMIPEFKESNVQFLETKIYFENEPQFDGGYHWFGNAENFFNIGDAMGKAMLKLLEHN
ncbi:TPA: sialate O-acetylesterase [Candidatus Poribacteria bacterium]|nr:sialate O-acetylesterase [Candidatus Poribacteria bacterium]HIC00645.1 sialate O-acetylesterase [Candidatus Poribacteria bacterium]HIO48143.1 sialate O-acetylesterase [Candidatus Poribacteria bacterium]